MNCKYTNVLMFAAGALIGSAVTWKVVKTRYERLMQEEIESVKEVFSVNLADDQDEEIDEESEEAQEPQETEHHINWADYEDLDEEEEESDEDTNEYASLVNKYINEKGGAVTMVAKEPYVISPTDFGELDGYNQIGLTYYADGVLEDEDWEIVTDVDELIGKGSLNTFGEYEDDSVFVRNEKLCTDFEILKDYRTYAESRMGAPNQVDD